MSSKVSAGICCWLSLKADEMELLENALEAFQESGSKLFRSSNRGLNSASKIGFMKKEMGTQDELLLNN